MRLSLNRLCLRLPARRGCCESVPRRVASCIRLSGHAVEQVMSVDHLKDVRESRLPYKRVLTPLIGSTRPGCRGESRPASASLAMLSNRLCRRLDLFNESLMHNLFNVSVQGASGITCSIAWHNAAEQVVLRLRKSIDKLPLVQ